MIKCKKIDLGEKSREINLQDIAVKDPVENEIQIKAVYTGICRSDIGAYMRWEEPPPAGMFGHEGVGIVNKIGKNVTTLKVDDYVATWWHPCYAEYYNVPIWTVTKISQLSTKYILQPTACGINIILETLSNIPNDCNNIVIFGTGFLSLIIAQYIKNKNINLGVCFVGNNNINYFKSLGVSVYQNVDDIVTLNKMCVIDLSSKANMFDVAMDYLSNSALYVSASTPFSPITTNFFKPSWKALKFIFPSPRSPLFQARFVLTSKLIDSDIINPELYFSKVYDLVDFKQAFEEGVNRSPGYIRGVIHFP